MALAAKIFVGVVAALMCVAYIGLHEYFGVKDSGTIYLKNAPGNVSIYKERETGMVHIEGDDWVSITYGQGFAVAQMRLWQLEMYRRTVNGELSEIFGSATLPMDQTIRALNVNRLAEEAIQGELTS